MIRRRALTLALVTALATAAHRAHANPVGEMHLRTADAQAELRNADHTQSVRVTIWYPADPHATEQKLQIGPPGHAIFTIGSDAPGAAPPLARKNIR